MALTILQVIESNKEKRCLQKDLLELCGYDMLTGVLDIVAHREELLSSFEVSFKYWYRYNIFIDRTARFPYRYHTIFIAFSIPVFKKTDTGTLYFHTGIKQKLVVNFCQQKSKFFS